MKDATLPPFGLSLACLKYAKVPPCRRNRTGEATWPWSQRPLPLFTPHSTASPTRIFTLSLTYQYSIQKSHLVDALKGVRPHGHRLRVVGELHRHRRVRRVHHIPLQITAEAVLLDLPGAELWEAVREAARYGLGSVHLGVRPHEEVVVVRDLLDYLFVRVPGICFWFQIRVLYKKKA